MLKTFLAAFTLLVSVCVARAEPDILILGEVHDNADAHLGQAEELRLLNPTAVVFEMLAPDQAAEADADRSRLPSIWARTNWPDFALYQPIFEAAQNARLVGAAAPRPTIMGVFKDGPTEHFGPDSNRFGLDGDLDSEQLASRVELQFQAHCEAMPREMMPGMVNVQRFRDALLARAALDALAEHGSPVAIITGNGHARNDWGVPAAISVAEPKVTVRSIAFVEAPTDVPYDEVRVVPPAEREDPCLSLRQDN